MFSIPFSNIFSILFIIFLLSPAYILTLAHQYSFFFSSGSVYSTDWNQAGDLLATASNDRLVKIAR
jgi:predicted membrane metal-binding protein